MVMPSWAPASCSVRSDVDSSASRSTRVPSAAASSSLVRREPTIENSSATKKPLTASSTNERANADQPLTSRASASGPSSAALDRRVGGGIGPVSSTASTRRPSMRDDLELPARRSSKWSPTAGMRPSRSSTNPASVSYSPSGGSNPVASSTSSGCSEPGTSHGP